ncbi:MAG: hypothetical protein K0R66_1022 [Gammaproteobacteria bacterium]|jgi:hypothetical protein|nr:hypothetical protein [Gammaproteobacteria bacterium]
MAIPIIMFYQGDAPYLWFTLRQTKLFNPDSEIILLGDKSNAHYPGVTHVLIENYFERAAQFEKIYQHLNSNPKKFELICMQRWLVIADYMKQHLQSCVHLDPDVMVYCDLSEQQKKFSQYDFTVNRQLGPQTMFINSREGLERFCEYFWSYYANSGKFSELQSWFKDYQGKGCKGGICDMWFFEHYAKLYPEKVGETFNLDANIYDNTIQHDDGFKMRFGKKKIIWKNKLPYAYHIASNQWKCFNTLHFQGYTKFYIPAYASSKNLRFYLQSLPYRAKLIWGLMQRVLSKIGLK